MRTDRFVYLSGPITAKHGFSVEENVASALRVYIDCLRAGIPSFCPHLSGAFPSAHSDVPYETWMLYDFAVIDRCTDVVMLPRWETSAGAVREMGYAAEHGIPVFSSLAAFIQAIDQPVSDPAVARTEGIATGGPRAPDTDRGTRITTEEQFGGVVPDRGSR